MLNWLFGRYRTLTSLLVMHVYDNPLFSAHNNIQHILTLFNIGHGPSLSYLHGKKLENREELTPIRIMINVGMNSENIVNNVGIFNNDVVLNRIPKE